jgi:hypothetical protein
MEFLIALIILLGAGAFLFSGKIHSFFSNTPDTVNDENNSISVSSNNTNQKLASVTSLKITNLIFFLLQVVGSLVLIYLGIYKGECINYCGSWDAEYTLDPIKVIIGVTLLLVSTLIFQIINVFAMHVERSHEK